MSASLSSVVASHDGASSLGPLSRDASRPTWRLPSFVLSCGNAPIRAFPFVTAPLVCASPLVAAHRARLQVLTAAC